MTPDELELLREGWDFEAKAAQGRDGQGALPSAFWTTYCAMANTEGGRILLGATERQDGTLDLVGLADVARVERDLWSTLDNPQKVSANVLRRQDVEPIPLGDRTLLLIRVPKAARADRPVYLNGSWENGAFVRVHEGDRRLGRDVARRMVADSVQDRDSGALDDLSTRDLHPDSVRRYREFLAARRPDHPFLDRVGDEFLVAIGAACKRPGGEIRPTWAGLWMLGDELAIRAALPHWHLSFKELPDDPDDPRRWLDRVHPDGVWNANVFQFYLRVIGKLHDGLKVPFRLEEGQYRIDETLVHDAVREALVNALVHADHQGTTGLRVLKRRSGFEFINPGLLLVSVEQVWRGGVSEPRNPNLQRMFGLLRLGEREGSGGPVMRQVWRAQHWRSPRIWEDVEHGETHLCMPLESLLPDTAVRAVVERLGEAFSGQDELGRLILVTAESEGRVSHARASELTDAHSRDVTLKLQELVRKGLLASSGPMHGKVYEPVLAVSDEASSRANEVSSRANEASSTLSEVSSEPSEQSTGLREEGSGRLAPRDQDVVERVRASGRAQPALVDQAILAVCSDAWLTTGEIAARIGRSTKSLLIRYLPRLVEEGRLRLRFPDRPRHPGQAYRAAGKIIVRGPGGP